MTKAAASYAWKYAGERGDPPGDVLTVQELLAALLLPSGATPPTRWRRRTAPAWTRSSRR